MFTVFAGLRVPGATGCHVTITMAKDVDAQVVEQMRVAWNALMAANESFRIVIGNYCRMGSAQQFEAYKCHIEDANVAARFAQYHRQFYVPSRKPGKHMYPKLKTHITVDTPQRLEEIESMIVGPQKGTFVVSERLFEVHNRVADEAAATFDAETWTCIACGNRNQLGARDCVPPCTQWRPKKAKIAYYGDWTCPGCQFVVFGRSDQCIKCAHARPE